VTAERERNISVTSTASQGGARRARAVGLAICWALLAWSTIALALDVARMDGWRDHGLFYYAPRAFAQGRNAYDWDVLKSEWRHDGRPLGIDPGTTMSGFVTPPSMAVLTLVPSLAPPRLGYRAIDLWNIGALAACILLLLSMARPRWPTEARILFTAFVLSLPDVAGVLLLGQTTLIVCACLCGALALLGSRRAGRWSQVAGGAAIGLALAKFTLSVPFLAMLAYRRRWRALAAAMVVFIMANVAFAAPGGVARTLTAFRAAVSRENRPGTSYDAISSNPTYMPNTLIHGKRLLYLLLGERRRLIDALNVLVSMAAVGAMAWVLRRTGRTGLTSEEPLEIALLTLAGLLLFYHRTYDLAALMLVGYALVDDGLRGADRRTPIWFAMAGVLLVLTHSAALVYGLKGILTLRVDLSAMLCWLNCSLLAALFVLCTIRLAGLRRGEPAVQVEQDKVATLSA
jgi:hypothetical protein